MKWFKVQKIRHEVYLNDIHSQYLISSEKFPPITIIPNSIPTSQWMENQRKKSPLSLSRMLTVSQKPGNKSFLYITIPRQFISVLWRRNGANFCCFLKVLIEPTVGQTALPRRIWVECRQFGSYFEILCYILLPLMKLKLFNNAICFVVQILYFSE